MIEYQRIRQLATHLAEQGTTIKLMQGETKVLGVPEENKYIVLLEDGTPMALMRFMNEYYLMTSTRDRCANCNSVLMPFDEVHACRGRNYCSNTCALATNNAAPEEIEIVNAADVGIK